MGSNAMELSAAEEGTVGLINGAHDQTGPVQGSSQATWVSSIEETAFQAVRNYEMLQQLLRNQRQVREIGRDNTILDEVMRCRQLLEEQQRRFEAFCWYGGKALAIIAVFMVWHFMLFLADFIGRSALQN